jgi:hypothetical protein
MPASITNSVSLPIELIGLFGEHCDGNTLKNLRQTNKTISRLVKPYLFRKIKLVPAQLEDFIKHLDANMHLAQRVEEMHFDGQFEFTGLAAFQRNLSVDAEAYAIYLRPIWLRYMMLEKDGSPRTRRLFPRLRVLRVRKTLAQERQLLQLFATYGARLNKVEMDGVALLSSRGARNTPWYCPVDKTTSSRNPAGAEKQGWTTVVGDRVDRRCLVKRLEESLEGSVPGHLQRGCDRCRTINGGLDLYIEKYILGMRIGEEAGHGAYGGTPGGGTQDASRATVWWTPAGERA